MSQSGLGKMWVTDSEHLHKAKRAVGDEEEFLALTNQPIQNSFSFFASQDELVCEEGEDRMLFNVQQCAGRIRRVERVVLPRSSMIHLYMKPFR